VNSCKTYSKPKDSWKSELRDFNSNNGFELNRNGDSGPLLLDVLEGFLKFEVFLSFFPLKMFAAKCETELYYL
jgi:hypothetical protein